ncbi:MAG: hypothetical protein FJY88_06120 [Candidatus Eisenbacteria bacterium]|nr:hypothetical protein [Candidatus Eisenbacteria bacterium]
MGLVYRLQGRKDLALAELRQAIRLAPDKIQYRMDLRDILKR